VSITTTLQDDMKAALRAGNKIELGALRLAIAALKRQAIDTRTTLTEDAEFAVLQKLIKQGKDSQQQFAAAGRDDLASKEAAEIAVFERYLPKALDGAELETLIRSTIADSGAAGIKDMGKVMAALKAKVQGRADMAAVSARVREVLSAQ
jgi:uncharacterized protein YqeY